MNGPCHAPQIPIAAAGLRPLCCTDLLARDHRRRNAFRQTAEPLRLHRRYTLVHSPSAHQSHGLVLSALSVYVRTRAFEAEAFLTSRPCACAGPNDGLPSEPTNVTPFGRELLCSIDDGAGRTCPPVNGTRTRCAAGFKNPALFSVRCPPPSDVHLTSLSCEPDRRALSFAS